MTQDAVITVRNLSKLYRIGQRVARYHTIRDTITHGISRAATALLHPGRAPEKAEDNTIWALRDVGFDVQQAEVVGVIGRNGAGKSTLLKVLSEITYPTEGRVEIHGRVGSLLEVGTGFHPELTGRENIFLNGAILGMKRVEIRRKFDEIVAFAEVDKFIDTPVKRYSSGMYVRLAFAVAAHLEPEILLVDEVLAVGDAQFQKKCLGKMDDVARKQGRTVLFVSHNMAAVQSLCNRCILLHGGRVECQGPTDDVIARYQAMLPKQKADHVDLREHTGRRRNSSPLMQRVTLTDGKGQPISVLPMGEGLNVEVSFIAKDRPLRPFLGVVIKNFIGASVFGIDNRMVPGFVLDAVTRGTVTCHFERLPLMPGSYTMDLYLGDEHISMDAIYDAVSFDVIPADVFGSGKLPHAGVGSVFWPATWSVRANAKP